MNIDNIHIRNGEMHKSLAFEKFLKNEITGEQLIKIVMQTEEEVKKIINNN